MSEINNISVVIPTFNERQNIKMIVPELFRAAKKGRLNLEVVVVDDDSPDKTGVEARRLFRKNRRVSVFIRKNNKGLGSAILYGIRKARGDVIVGIDADFNHDPSKLSVLTNKLRECDLVVASRLLPGGGMGHRLRYYPTLIFNLFLHYILGFPTMDNMSGYYAIRKEELMGFPLKEIYKGYGEYHLRLVYLAKRKGLKIIEVPYYSPVRKYGRSKSRLGYMFLKYLQVSLALFLGKEDSQKSK